MPSNGRYEAVYNRDYIQDIAAQNEAISRAYWRPHNVMLAPLIMFYAVIGCLFVAIADGVLKPIIPDQQMSLRVALSVVLGGLLAYVINSFWFDAAWNVVVRQGLTRGRSAGDMRVRFDEAGITWTAVDSETFVAWPGIERVVLRETAIVIFNTPNAYIIPRDAFGTDADLARMFEHDLLPRLMTSVREATEADGTVRGLMQKSAGSSKPKKQKKTKPESTFAVDAAEAEAEASGNLARATTAPSGSLDDVTADDCALADVAAHSETFDAPQRPRVFGRATTVTHAPVPAIAPPADVKVAPVPVTGTVPSFDQVPAWTAAPSAADETLVGADELRTEEPLGFGPPVMAPPVFGKIPSRKGLRPQASATATGPETAPASTAQPLMPAPVTPSFGHPASTARAASISRTVFGQARPGDDIFSSSDLLAEPPFMAQTRTHATSLPPSAPSLTFERDTEPGRNGVVPEDKNVSREPAPAPAAAKTQAMFWPSPSTAWQALSGGRKPKLIGPDPHAQATAMTEAANSQSVPFDTADVFDGLAARGMDAHSLADSPVSTLIEAAQTPNAPELADWPEVETAAPAPVTSRVDASSAPMMLETIVQQAPAEDLGYWRLSKRRMKGRKGSDGPSAAP
ncbi:MAG: YcxB family protein [Hyphomicrobiaceae bacterium]|nr:YcxB family protein [Hyphomicrobiaceae bacterium]